MSTNENDPAGQIKTAREGDVHVGPIWDYAGAVAGETDVWE